MNPAPEFNEQLDNLVADHRLGKHFVMTYVGNEPQRKWTQPAPAANDGFPGCPACAQGLPTYNVEEDAIRFRVTRKSDEYWEVSDLTGLARVSEYKARHVEVWGPTIRFGNRAASQVGWSGCGSLEPEVAQRYARLIQVAAEIAQELDAAAS